MSLTPAKLKIAGPNGVPYALGMPMWVYVQDVLLARLDPVPLLNTGTELHIEAFEPTRVVREERRHVGKVIFLEICAHIAENFQQIQAIRFALSRQVDLFSGGGTELAASRSETMMRIGAVDVRMTPRSDAKSGHFVVSGTWVYSERNYAHLMSVLQEERLNYKDRPIGSRNRDAAGVVARLRHLVCGRA
jgi:hypothetical protein